MLYVHATYPSLLAANVAVRALDRMRISPAALRVFIRGSTAVEKPLAVGTALKGSAVGAAIGALVGAAIVTAGLLSAPHVNLVELALRGGIMGAVLGALGGALRGVRPRLSYLVESDERDDEEEEVSVGVLTTEQHSEAVRGALVESGGTEVLSDWPSPEILAMPPVPVRLETTGRGRAAI